MDEKLKISRLPTGVPGLDALLGGGLPEFSFNLIAGAPGSGKTTLAHQIMFSLANPDRRALFFTVLGEPALKMLRYQQQFKFFDVNKVNESIRFINLAADLSEGTFDGVLSRIFKEVKDYGSTLVFVDSFRSVVHAAKAEDQKGSELQQFIQKLGVEMTSWQATTFLVGEYLKPEAEASPVFTVSDGILWLSQNLRRSSVVRKMQVIKMRGQAHAPGLHAFRINDSGLEVFPRTTIAPKEEAESAKKRLIRDERVSVGMPDLDEMLGGGLPVGYSLLVVGPSGSGKTVFATEFLAEGARNGEIGVLAAFEKSPSQLLSSKLSSLIAAGRVETLDTHALDLSIDETLHDLMKIIDRMGAKRLVIDSLSGFELALAPEFSEDFRGSLYRMIARLTAMGVTILMTSELEDRFTDFRFSAFGSAFLADAIIVQRYTEIKGQFKRVLSVVKIRGSEHSKDIRLFEVTKEGVVIGETLSGYNGIISGHPFPSWVQRTERGEI